MISRNERGKEDDSSLLKNVFGLIFTETENNTIFNIVRIWAVLILLLSTFLLTVYQLIVLKEAQDGYAIGDWLISYPEVYIRRGLIGEIAVYLHDQIGWSPIWFTGILKIAVYFTFVGLFLRLFCSVRSSGLILLLMFSPAFFLFPFYSAFSSFRKEVLGFLVLSLMANAVISSNALLRSFLLLLSIIAFAVAVFAHEANSLFAPHMIMIVGVLLNSRKIGPGEAIAFVSATALVAVLAISLGMSNPGIGYSSAVCEELLKRNLPASICDGSIRWLEADLSYVFMHLSDWIRNHGYIEKYGFLAILSFTPFFLFKTQFGGRFGDALFLGMGVLAFAPLYAVAVDWGRWIYMTVTAMTILVLCLKHEGLISERIGLAALLTPLYAMLWRVPECCSEGFGSAVPYLNTMVSDWLLTFHQEFFL